MKNVILIGFMGCGKSTVGIRLSYRLRCVVEDTDKLIEKKEGKTISDIFKEYGEPYFRELETACLEDLQELKDDRIISTGGGLPMKKQNHALLKSLGTVVYLQISPECVYERLKNDTTRPLLQCEDPLSKIKELLHKRAPIYEEAADVIVNVDGKDMEQVLAEIADRLRERGFSVGGAEDEVIGD